MSEKNYLDKLLDKMNELKGDKLESDLPLDHEYWLARNEYHQALHLANGVHIPMSTSFPPAFEGGPTPAPVVPPVVPPAVPDPTLEGGPTSDPKQPPSFGGGPTPAPTGTGTPTSSSSTTK